MTFHFSFWSIPETFPFKEFLIHFCLTSVLVCHSSGKVLMLWSLLTTSKTNITHLLSLMLLVPDPITTQVKVIILSLQSDLILQIEFLVSKRLTIVGVGSTATRVIYSITYCWLRVEDSGKDLH